MRKVYSLALLAAASLGMAASANAAISGPYSDSQTLTNSRDVTLTFPQFNTATGTLTGVNVDFRIELAGVIVAMDNDADVAQTGTALVQTTVNSLTSNVTLQKSDLSTINKGSLSSIVSRQFSLSPTTGDAVGAFNATGNDDYAIWQPLMISVSDSGDISSGVWAGYQGTGNITVTTNALYLTSATFVGNDGYFQGNTPDATFRGTITYTFTAIPEPVMFGIMGLAATVLMRRRRQA